MNGCMASPGSLCKLAGAVLLMMLAGCRHVDSQGDADMDRIRDRIEGIYSFAAWHTASEVHRPPAVDGRATLKNGTIIFIIHDRRRESATVTTATYGEYRLTAKEFAYRYVSPSNFTETNGGITVAHTFPWQGMRVFDVIREGDNVRLRAQEGPQEFLFTAEGHTYADGGLDNVAVGKRVWSRIR